MLSTAIFRQGLIRMSQNFLWSINETSTFFGIQIQCKSVVSGGWFDKQAKHQIQKQFYSMDTRDKATKQLEEYKDAKKVIVIACLCSVVIKIKTRGYSSTKTGFLFVVYNTKRQSF